MTSRAQLDAQSLEATGHPLISVDGDLGPLPTIDLNLGLVHQVTVSQNAQFQPPANAPKYPVRVILTIVQDAVGSRTVTWAKCFRDAPSLGSSGPAGSTATVEFWADGFGSYQFMGGASTFAIVGSQLIPAAGGVAVAGTQAVNAANQSIAPGAGATTVAGVAPTRTP